MPVLSSVTKWWKDSHTILKLTVIVMMTSTFVSSDGSLLTQSAAQTACQQRNDYFLPRVTNRNIQSKLTLFRNVSRNLLRYSKTGFGSMSSCSRYLSLDWQLWASRLVCSSTLTSATKWWKDSHIVLKLTVSDNVAKLIFCSVWYDTIVCIKRAVNSWRAANLVHYTGYLLYYLLVCVFVNAITLESFEISSWNFYGSI